MRHLRTWPAVIAAAALLMFMLAGTASAHARLTVGDYTIALGWVNEPAYAGQVNAIQALVSNADGSPVTDLASGDLKVIVSAAGQTSHPFALEPAFDVEEGWGTPGDYHASIMPTSAGDFTFHITGSIHGQSVDESVTSGEDTFSTPQDPTAIQVPNKLPTVGDLATRVDRVDARASSDSSTAMYVGAGLAIIGIVIGVAALAVALRNRARSA